MIRLFDDGGPLERPAPIEYTRSIYPAGEIYVKLPDIPFRSRPIRIQWDFEGSDEIIEIALLVNALRNAGRFNVDLQCPYLPYARQDRVCRPGESFSLEVIGKIINSLVFNRVIVWDVHSDVARIQIDKLVNFPLADLLASKRHLLTKWDNAAFIAPDAGAIQRAIAVAGKFGRSAVVSNKVRDPETGNITIEFNGAVLASNKDVVMVDDICDGGRTFIELEKKIRPYTTGKIYLLVTHGIFSAGFGELRKHIDHIWVANPMCGVPEDYVTVI